MSDTTPEQAPGSPDQVLEADWLRLCRRVVERQRELFRETVGIEARTKYEGVGEGGDHTLVLDRRAEDVVFEELERLAGEGLRFTAISEERGQVEFNGGGGAYVVIDPIDGSMNFRRTIPSHAVSIAVASGPSMADVEFGFVHDFGPDEEFAATRGGGATLNGEALPPVSQVAPDDGPPMEALGLEGADPEFVLSVVGALGNCFYRLRCLGALANTVTYVAAGRLDGCVGPPHCRSVDIAAAQLIARETGATVLFGEMPLEEVGFALEDRFPVVAANTPDSAELLRRAHAAGVAAE